MRLVRYDGDGVLMILNINKHILKIILYLRGSQCSLTKKGEIRQNIEVRETRRAAELKALVKGYRVDSGKP